MMDPRPHLGYPRCPDAGEGGGDGDGHDVPEVGVDIVHLGNVERRHSLVQSCSVLRCKITLVHTEL